jgi:cytochrome c556
MSIGDRVDQAVQAAKDAVNSLRDQLAAKAAEVGPEINAAVDAVQAKIDEIQAAVAERGNQAGQQPATQQPAGGVSGGTQPPA